MTDTLRVRVVRAKGLLNRDWGFSGKSDPYVKVYDPDGKERLKTPVIEDVLDPEWPADKSTVSLKVPQAASAQLAWSADKVFKFVVWNSNPITDDFLGECQVAMAEARPGAETTHTVPLQPRSSEPDKAIREAKSLGALTVAITWPTAPKPQSAAAQPPASTSANPAAPASPVTAQTKPTPPAVQPTPADDRQTKATPAAVQPTPQTTEQKSAAVAAASARPSAQGVASASTTRPTSVPQPTAAQSPPGQLTTQVVGGSGLLNRERFSTSDPYVKVFGPDGKEWLKTPALDGTLDPRWPAQKSTTTQRVDSRNGMLRFEVWDENTVSDEPMGAALVSVADALAYAGIDGDITIPLGARENESDKRISEAAGAGRLGVLLLRFSFAKETAKAAPPPPPPAAAGASSASTTTRPTSVPQPTAAQSPPGQLTTQVVGGSGLLNRERFSTSDPYVKVFGPDGKEWLKTPALDGTLDPRWPAQKSTTTQRVDSRNGMLRFEVWDENTVSDEPMGAALVSVADALAYAGIDGDITIPLGARENESDKRISEAAGAGRLGVLLLRFSFAKETAKAAPPPPPPAAAGASSASTTTRPTSVPQPTAAQSPPGQLTTQVVGGSGLLNRERFSTSDPYVKVFGPDGKEWLKTPALDGTLDPRWPAQKSTTTQRVDSRNGMLRFEVWDENTVSDEPMGAALVSVADALAYAGIDGDITIPLGARENESDKRISEAAGAGRLGVLLLRFSFAKETAKAAPPPPPPAAAGASSASTTTRPTSVPQPTAAQSPPGQLTTQVVGGSGLLNRERFSTSDPYVKVFGPDGKEWLKTPALDGTLDPRWPAQKSTTTQRVDSRNGMLRFEVWDENTVSDEPMGAALVSVADALAYAGIDGDITIPLGARENESDKRISEAAGAGRLGVLLLRFSFAKETAKAAPPPPPPAAAGASSASTTTRPTSVPQPTAAQSPPGQLTTQVVGGSGLLNRERFSTSDPYVKVFGPDGKEWLKTPALDGTLDPRWPAQKSTTTQRVDSRNGMLRFEVWDENTVSDEPMGAALVSVADALAYAGIDGDITIPLGARENESDKRISEAAGAGRLGVLLLRFSFAKETAKAAPPPPPPAAAGASSASTTTRPTSVPQPTAAQSPPGQLTTQVVGGSGLLNRERFSTSDPYVKVFGPDGKEWLKTPALDGTLDPRWPAQKSTTTQRVDSRNGMLRFEVWDENTVSDEPMGAALVSVADALAYAGIDGDITIPLGARENESDKRISEAAGAGRLGVLLLRFSFAVEAQKASPSSLEKRSRGLPEASGKSDSDVFLLLVGIASVRDVRWRVDAAEPLALVRLTVGPCAVATFGPFTVADLASCPCVLAGTCGTDATVKIELLDASREDNALPLGVCDISASQLLAVATQQHAASFDCLDAYHRVGGVASITATRLDGAGARQATRVEVREVKDMRIDDGDVDFTFKCGAEVRSTRGVVANNACFLGSALEFASSGTADLSVELTRRGKVVGSGAVKSMAGTGQRWITLVDRSGKALGLLFIGWVAPPIGGIAIDRFVVGPVLEQTDVIRITHCAKTKTSAAQHVSLAIRAGKAVLSCNDVAVSQGVPQAAWTIPNAASAQLEIGCRRSDDPSAELQWKRLPREAGSTSIAFSDADVVVEQWFTGKGNGVQAAKSFAGIVVAIDAVDGIKTRSDRMTCSTVVDGAERLIGEVPLTSGNSSSRQLVFIDTGSIRNESADLRFALDDAAGNRLTAKATFASSTPSPVSVVVPFGPATRGTVALQAWWVDAAAWRQPQVHDMVLVSMRLGKISFADQQAVAANAFVAARVELGNATAWTPPQKIKSASRALSLDVELVLCASRDVDTVKVFLVTAANAGDLRANSDRFETIGVASLKAVTGNVAASAKRGSTNTATMELQLTVVHSGAPVAESKVGQRGIAHSVTAPPTPVQVVCLSNRPFTTMMDADEPVSNLAPFLARHFGVPVEQQRLTHSGNPLRMKDTLSGNRCVAEHGITQLALSHGDRKLLALQVRLPDGAVLPLYVPPSTTVAELKAAVVAEAARREMAALLPRGADAAKRLRLSHDFRDMADGDTLAAMKPGAAIVVEGDARDRKPGGGATPGSTVKSQRGTAGADDVIHVVVEGTQPPKAAHISTRKSMAALKALLGIDAREQIFVDGVAVDEGCTLQQLNVTGTSRVSVAPTAASRGSPTGPRGNGSAPASPKAITIDVEDPAGYVRTVDVATDAPLSALRHDLEADHATYQLFWNGRRVRNEQVTFAQLAVPPGAHLQFRDPLNASSTRQRHDHARAAAQADELMAAVATLQAELQALQRQHAVREKETRDRAMELDAQLRQQTARANAAEERVEELEAALVRNRVLLKRAAGYSDPSGGGGHLGDTWPSQRR
jgi:hypothetical protein